MGAGRSRSVSISSPTGGDSDIDTKQTSHYGVSASSMFNNDEDFEDVDYVLELEKQGLDSLEKVLDKQGFSGLPRQMSKEEFEQFVKDGGIELARGIQSSSEEQYNEYVDSLLYGDFYVAGGEAYFGKGMYAYGGEDLNLANGYGDIIHIALSPDAKIYTPKAIEKHSKEVLDGKERLGKENNDIYNGFAYTMKQVGLKPVEVNFYDFNNDIGAMMKADDLTKVKNKKIGREYLKKTLSKKDYNILKEYNAPTKPRNNVLAAKGYDAIRLPREYVRATSKNTGEIWIVLNRTKLTILNEKGR